MAENENFEKPGQPILESSISSSKDGKWVIFKTTITTIKPVRYVEKVISPDE